MSELPDISIVVPLFNERENLAILCEQLVQVLEEVGKPYEILFIDDGSTDGSLEELRRIRQKSPHVRLFSFRRNLGKSLALALGFQEARGQVIITLDADLQDDPTEIPRLLEVLAQGYDSVSGWRINRQDPLLKRILSKVFNWVTSRISGLPLHDFNCGFKAYRREAIRQLILYGSLHRFIPVLLHWAGFRVGEVPVRHHRRRFGHSKFGAARLWHGFFDLLVAIFLNRFTSHPLHLFGWLGFGTLLAGLGISTYLAVLWFLGHGPIGTRPLFTLGVLLIILGVQFISLGLLAEMIVYFNVQEDQKNNRELLKTYLRQEEDS